MADTADVVIIGAGVIGCSIALSLSRVGLRTLNIDALPAAGYGSTSHSSAIIRPLYSHMEAAALAHEARWRWLHWQDFLKAPKDEPLARYTECGLLSLVAEGGDDHEAACKAMTEAGVNWTPLTPDDLVKRFPSLALSSFAPVRLRHDTRFGEPNGMRLTGAIHVAEAGFVNDPALAANNLKEAAIREGAIFRFGARVEEVASSGGRIHSVRIDDGSRVETPIVINAAGPHSARVNEMASVNLEISTRALRHEVAYVPWPTTLRSEKSRMVVTDLDTGVYVRPDGADMLIGTLDPPCDTRDVVDPDDYNDGFTDQWTTQVWRAAQRFPDLEIPGQARGTIGLYDASDDWIPVYDKTDLDGYFLAIGTSGNQFKNAPLIGELMTRIITACTKGHDHDRDPLELHLQRLDRNISLGHYSRLREVQATANVLA